MPPGVGAHYGFEPQNSEEVGLTTVVDNNNLDGTQVLDLEFDDFTGNEVFNFNIDTEDDSGGAVVAGENFAGSTISVTILVAGNEHTLTAIFEKLEAFSS